MKSNEPNDGGVSVQCAGLWKVYGPKPKLYIEKARGFEPGAHPLDGEYTAAVRDVSFDVRPGETFVVMGLSGSGKSTLVRCLTRLIEPTQGEIRIDGKSVEGMSRTELRNMRRQDCAMVFQHFGLLPHRRVIENVAYGLEVAGVSKRMRESRAEEVLTLVGLAGWERRFPAELSGGMRQRVGLARALAVDPRLMLLDEPFSALDPLIRRELQDELVRLASVVRQTSVFITHDMHEALKVGDRIAIMRSGEIVQIGTPEEIVLAPVDDYVRRFAEDASRLQVVQARTITKNPPAVSGSADAAQALAVARTGGFDSVVVVDQSDRPMGTIAAEALETAAARDLAVADLALTTMVSVRPNAVLAEVMQLLVGPVSQVAVVDDRGTCLGVIDRKSVIAALLSATAPSSQDGLRVAV